MLNSYIGSIIIFTSLLSLTTSASNTVLEKRSCSKIIPNQCKLWKVRGDAQISSAVASGSQSVPGYKNTCKAGPTCGPFSSPGLLVKYIDGGSGLSFNPINFPNLPIGFTPIQSFLSAPLPIGLNCIPSLKKTQTWLINAMPTYASSIMDCVGPDPKWCKGDLPSITLYTPVTLKQGGYNAVPVDSKVYGCISP